MKPLIANATGHIIADIDGEHMLVDTAATTTFYDEYQGVRVSDLSRMIGTPINGVMGMDRLVGRVVSLTRNGIQLDAASPQSEGIPLDYLSGTPVVDLDINGVPSCAAIKTSATITYLAEERLSRHRYSRTVNDIHPLYGPIKVDTFVNYFSIADKHYFAEAGGIPAEFSLLSSTGVDAIIGSDILKRFDLIMDFSEGRLHLLSR